MPKYSREVTIPGKSSQELYEVVCTDIDRVFEKFSLGDFDIERNSEELWVEVDSKLFSARLMCENEVLRLEANLSFMAAPFRGKIDEGINRWLEKTFKLKL